MLDLALGTGLGPMVLSSRPVVSVVSGAGYAGSLYQCTSAGQWTADGVAIGGETGATFTMRAEYEGSIIRCGASNGIRKWVPADLASIVAWWDASAEAEITSTAGAVQSWTDRLAGLTLVAPGTAANQPATGSETLNGLNTLVFGGNDRLTRADALGFSGNPAITVAIVSRPVTLGVGAVQLGAASGAGGQVIGFATGDTSFRYNNGAQQFNSGSTDGSSWFATLFARASGVSYDGGACWRNNVSLSQASAVNPANTPALADENMTCGCIVSSNGSLTHVQETIAEVIVFGTVLAAAERTALWAYHQAKWGL